jgi:hypothetical protein
VKSLESEIEKRLARLRHETLGIVPRAGFSARVMQAVEAESAVGGLLGMSRVARRVLPVALLLAVSAVSLAVQSESSAEEALAVSYAGLELEW